MRGIWGQTLRAKEAGEAWINGKILLSLLTEKYLGDIDFSPTWNIRSEPEHMEGNETGVFYNFYDHGAWPQTSGYTER